MEGRPLNGCHIVYIWMGLMGGHGVGTGSGVRNHKWHLSLSSRILNQLSYGRQAHSIKISAALTRSGRVHAPSMCGHDGPSHPDLRAGWTRPGAGVSGQPGAPHTWAHRSLQAYTWKGRKHSGQADCQKRSHCLFIRCFLFYIPRLSKIIWILPFSF